MTQIKVMAAEKTLRDPSAQAAVTLQGVGAAEARVPVWLSPTLPKPSEQIWQHES